MTEKRFYIVKNITSGEVNSPLVNRIDGTIIIYPKLRNNIVYVDDNNKTYVYKIKKV